MKPLPGPRRGSILLCVSLMVSLLLLTGSVASAQAPAKANRAAAEHLTQSLMALNAQYRTAPPEGKAALLLQLQSVAAKRQQVLSALVQSSPGEVLRVAIPGNMAAGLAPEIQSSVEQETDTQGELEVIYEDAQSGATLHHYLKAGGQRLELKFAADAPTNLLTGSIVRVHGTRVGSALALGSGSSTGSFQVVQAAPLSNTFGAQRTLVILVNFQDNPVQPYAAADAYSIMFGSSGSVSGYDLETSYQQTWLTGNVAGWYTIALNSTTWGCDTLGMMNDANQAATAAGINVSAYAHLIYAFPSNGSCHWWGLGTIGGSPQTEAWINGPFETKVVSHEMGHNFGLYHSHAWNCGSTTLGSNCFSIEYGDTLDTMGNPSAGHFNAAQKERLGWLSYGSSPPIQTVQSNGTYLIGPYEIQDGTTKALKILKSTDPTTGAHAWYYVEFRQSIGTFDYWPSNTNVLGGVVIHTEADNDPSSDELLNMAPPSGCCGTPALDVGQTFIDPAAGLTLETTSANSNGASVSVTFGTPACANANPTVSFSPAQSQTVMPGTTVAFAVSITNNDNAGCNASTFNLASSVPTGWSAMLANPSLVLSPGTSRSTTLQVTSPSSAASALYNVFASATNASATTGTYSGSGSAVYVLNTTPCIHANPTVSFSPNQTPSLAPGTQEVFRLSITNNDNSVCSPTQFNLSDAIPSGWTGTLGMSWLTIAPGNSSGTYVYVTSPTNAAGGSYPIGGTATSTTTSGEGASASAIYVVSGSNTCTRANPSVTMSPSQSQSVSPGTPVAFTVSVTDNDSSACTSTNFNLADALPSGWNGTWSSSAVALSPGHSSSATLTVASPPTAASGSYTIGTTATDASATTYAGSATGTYVASTGNTGSISISTNSYDYLPGQTVGITVTVTSGGSPVSGASVQVAVTNPKGNVSTLSGTTGSSGVASLSYNLRKQAPAGIYQVQASIASTRKAVSTAPASTTFAVQ